MSILQNLEYDKAIISTIALVTSLGTLPSLNAGENIINLRQNAPYDKYIDYSYSKQSTSDECLLKNDKKMLRDMEIYDINKIIKNKYGVKIVDFWLPAYEKLEKICLFVNLENQDELVSKYDDFELELYITLEEKLKQSQLINMIALI